MIGVIFKIFKLENTNDFHLFYKRPHFALQEVSFWALIGGFLQYERMPFTK